MRGLCLLLLLGFVGILVGDSLREIPQFVRRGHFAGRSGNVVVLPKEQSVTPSLLLLDQQRQHFIHEDSVEDVNLANLISHLFQSAPPSNEKDFMSIDRKNFPVISLFSAPAANVFVAIEDVSKSDLEKYPTLSMLQNRKQLDIVPTYRARDTLSTLETFLSGVTPSQHGIVGRSWLSPSGTEAFAFRDSGSSSRADSLFDVLALTSPSSLIVSMSSDYQYASAIGVRAQAMRNSPNVLSYFWNSKHQNFDSISGPRAEHSIQASRADILQSLKEKEMFNDIDGVMVAYDAKNMQAFVSARSTKVHTVPFDLNSEEDFRLFVEVFFVQMFRQVMKQDNFQSLIHDPTSDSYAFAFDGVSKIKNKYGVDSPQFSAALYLTDSAVKSLVGEISSAYHGKISSQIACIAPIPTFELPDEVTQQLDDALPSGLSNFLPDIYMGNELTLNEEKSLVIQMNTLLENFGFTAYWFGRQELHYQDIYLSGRSGGGEHAKKTSVTSARSMMEPRTEDFGWNVYKWFGFHYNQSGVTYTVHEINNYQVTLWTGVVLIFIGYGGCCVMCLLDPEKNNELLYRTTSLGRETDTIPGGDYDFKPM